MVTFLVKNKKISSVSKNGENIMPISVIDLYKNFLPKTNCGDCKQTTCFAFATFVITEKYPIENCPHLDQKSISKLHKQLKQQYASGKWLKKDPAKDAMEWAKSRASSIKIEDLPAKIGGRTITVSNEPAHELPYFSDIVIITDHDITKIDGTKVTLYEQVFIYNHIAQGGHVNPTGNWKGFQEFPNTISKIKSMIDHVEKPIAARFSRKTDDLLSEAKKIGGQDISDKIESPDLSIEFLPLPKIPIRLIFHDEIRTEAIDADVKLLFDETIVEHLDIESIMFLSERLKQLLCGNEC